MSFTPWVGSLYGQPLNCLGGKRLMILGESHYTKDPVKVGTTDFDLTEGVVLGLAIEGRHEFFSKLMEITLRRPRSTFTKAEATAFWQSVVFYNYVPVYADGRTRSEGGAERRPTEEMFEAGAEPLHRVLAAQKPAAVIVCGLTLWDWVAPHLRYFTGESRDVIFYDDGETVFARIHHPSYVRFDPTYWYTRMERLLEMAAEPRECGRKILWKKADDE